MNVIDYLDRKLDQLMVEPDNSYLFNEIGVLLYQLKDWKRAERYSERAYMLNAKDNDILYNYASILYHNSEFYRAIPIYEAYMEVNKADKEVLKRMGDCYYQVGAYESAAKIYQQLLKE